MSLKGREMWRGEADMLKMQENVAGLWGVWHCVSMAWEQGAEDVSAESYLDGPRKLRSSHERGGDLVNVGFS
jgi:hypothetical protein